MRGLSLYRLHERIIEIVVDIEDAEQANDTELVDELENTLDKLFLAVDAKREATVHVIRSAEAQSKALREESRRFSDRARNMDNLVTRLKRLLLEGMQRTGEVRADAGKFNLHVAESPPSVVFRVPPEMLPAKYRKVKVLPDTAAINLDLRKGIEVEGAELHQGTHLRIQ